MPITDRRPVSDFERDAKKHGLLLLALQRATSEIRALEQGGRLGIDQVLDRLLPDLAQALNAVQAFVAVLRTERGGDRWFELTAVHPRQELRGQRLACSGVLEEIAGDGQPRVIDSFEERAAPIPGLELFEATSAVVVELRTASHVRVVGICNKAHPDLGLFLAADRMALDSLVELVAIGARLGEQRSQELKQIQKTSAAISAELDVSELLPAIVNGAADIFGAPAVSLMLWDEGEESLVIEAGCGLSDEYVQQQCIPKDKVLAAIPLTGDPRPIVAPDLRVAPFGRRDLIEREQLCSVLTAPLLASRKMIGILNIYSKAEPRQFSPDEIELAEILANQAAIAIQNARLRQRELKSLEVTSAAIGSTLDLNVLLPLITHKASEMFEAPATSLMLWDDAKENLVIQASYGLSDEYTRRQRIAKDKISTLVTALGGPKPEVIWGATLDLLGEPELYRREHIHKVLSAPLVVLNQLAGVLNIYSQEPSRSFTPDEKELAAIYANQAVIAIENARLFSTSEESREYLNALVASSFDAVIAIDGADRITVFNKQAEVMLGYTAKEMYGHSVARLHWDIEEARKIRDMVSQGAAVSGYETRLKDREGRQIPTSLSAISIKDAAGNEIGQAGFMRDLRRIRSLEDRLRALVEVGQIIGGTLDLHEVYELVVGAAVAAFPTAQKGSLHLMDADTGLLRIKASVGYPPDIVERVALRVGEGRAGWVYKHAAPLNVGNVQTHELTKRFDYPQELDQKSTLCVPILLRHQPIGALSVDSVTEYDAFDPADLGILSTLANQAAIAIENARLYGTARRRMEELDRLRTVGQAIVGRVTERPKEVLEQIAIGACRVVAADSAIIYPLLTETQAYDVENIGSYGLLSDKGFDAAKRRGALDSMTGIVLQQGMVVVDDVSARVDRSGQVKMHTQEGGFLRREGVKSFVGVSLTFGGKAMGVLFVNFRQVHRFADDELSLITILANQAAGAIRQARLFEQVTRVRESARQVAQASVLGDLTSTLESIVKAARSVLRCDVVTLHAFDERLQRFTQVVADGYFQQKHIRQPDQITSSSVLWNILDLQKPYYHFAEDTPGDSLLRGDFVEKEQVKSSLGILLRYEVWRVGVMFVNYRTLHGFSDDELSDAQLLANQAAIAIYNARLYADLQRRIKHQEALYEASKAITAGFSLERKRVLDSIVEQAVERITSVHGRKATWGAIQLYDEVSHGLVFESVYPQEELTLLKAKLGEKRSLDRAQAASGRIGMTGRAVLERKPQLARDVKADPDYVEYDMATQSELDVPLLDGDQVVGVLSVESDEMAAFDEDDEQTFMGLAELAVIAIKNAEQARRLSRTNAFAVMGAWGAEIAHEVNREVGTIRLAVNSARRRMNSPQRLAQCLDEIDACAERLGLPAPPEQAPKPGQVIEFRDAPLLDETVQVVIETVRQEFASQASVSIEADLQCDGVRAAMPLYWLSRLIQHLVRNAARVIMPDGKDNRVTVRTVVRDTLAEVSVQDTGPGIPLDKVPLLFNQPVPRGDGTQGRGLLVVSYIASVYGGSARLVWNRVGVGACFAFTVPLARSLK